MALQWRITEVSVVGPDGVRRKPKGKVWRKYLRAFQARHWRRGRMTVYGAPEAERARQRRQQYHQRRRNRVKRG